MTKKSLSVLLLISLLSISFTACNKKPAVTTEPFFPEEIPLVTSSSSSSTSETSVSTETEGSISFEKPVDDEKPVIGFKLIVVNQCKADIGMVCMLDPVTAEQRNIGPLSDGTALIMDFDGWPEEKVNLDIAFYNKNGDLVSSTEVDITGVTSTVTVYLSGDGNIDSVKGEVQ